MISIPGSMVAPFTREQLEQIHGQVIELLGTVGMKVINGKLRQLLEKEGFEVDKASRRVKFSVDIIEETIKSIRKDNRGEENYRRMRTGEISGFPYGLCGAPFIYHWRTGKRVTAKKRDLIKMIRIGEVIEEAGFIGAPLIMSDVDPRIERVKALALLIENTSKPVSAEYYYANQLKYILELVDIIGQHFRGDTPGGYVISPLTLGEKTTTSLFEGSKLGIPDISIGSVAVTGVTAPATIVGTVTFGAAEILGGWIIAKAIDRKAKMGANITSGTMDMSTGKICFCTPETVIQDAGVSQLWKEIYGGSRIYNISSAWVDAKTPGIQAVWEKCFNQLTLGSIGITSFHYGLLEGGLSFCPTQAVIDYEINNMLESTFRNIQVAEEIMPVPEIKKVIDANSTFLESEHTLKHFRKSIWTPKLLDRTIWRGHTSEVNADKELLEKAEKRWHKALQTYKPPQRESSTIKAVRDVVHRAEEELLL